MTAGSNRVIVLGANGMLGSMVVRVAAQQGHDVVPVTRGSFGFDVNAAADDWLRQIGPADLIVNCVAVTRMPERSADVVDCAYRVNAWFPRRLAEAAKRAGIRLV